MSLLNGKVEAEVVRINRIDTDVFLSISNTIIAYHDTLYICRTIALISDVGGHLGTIHRRKPGRPVTIRLHGRYAGCIAIAPTVIVGTQDGILSGTILRGECNEEVVPVGTAIGIVDEVNGVCLAYRYLDVLRMGTPEGVSVILITNDCIKY